MWTAPSGSSREDIRVIEMGISIGICELEAESALCRKLKLDIQKVKLEDDAGFEDVVETDRIVSLEDAERIFPDWEAFLKRNRINAETDAIYMEKVKNGSDAKSLESAVKEVRTGWVDTKDLDADMLDKAKAASNRENDVTGWFLLSFDEMNETCAKCPLSWDKGRGCIGAFGPDNSALPEIASRHGCDIVASVPAAVGSKRMYTPAEGAKLAEEVEILTAALPEEGKMMVRRYSGPLERLGAVAAISVRENCGFYFF